MLGGVWLRAGCFAVGPEALGGGEGWRGKDKSAWAQASHTLGSTDPVISESSRKTPNLQPSGPAQKGLPLVLPSPFPSALGPPSPKFGAYLFLLSQSRTILVCPNADRTQLECGECVSVYTRGSPGPVVQQAPSSLSSQGPGTPGRGRA